MRLQDKVALVTGGGAGLGRSHALLLAHHGAKVIVIDVGPGAEQVAAEIQAAGGTAIAATASVTDEDKIVALAEQTKQRWGRIDILVNNAGILRDASFAKMSIADFRAVVDVHLMGAVICTKAVWETMRQQNSGRIVMTTSSTGLFGNFGQSNYGAAKMALVGLMQTLSIEGAKHDIRVNCLAPIAATAMTENLMPEPMRDLLKPEFVSPGLIHLVGDDAPTRAILCVGAGHFARSYVTLTEGAQIGIGAGVEDRITARWAEIGDRSHESVPDRGNAQVESELAAYSRAQTSGKA